MPAPNRIGSRCENNGKCPGRLLDGQGRGCASSGHDHINLERNWFGRESGEPLRLPLGIAVFGHEVDALDVTEITQSFTEGLMQACTGAPRRAPWSAVPRRACEGSGCAESSSRALSDISQSSSPFVWLTAARPASVGPELPHGSAFARVVQGAWHQRRMH